MKADLSGSGLDLPILSTYCNFIQKANDPEEPCNDPSEVDEHEVHGCENPIPRERPHSTVVPGNNVDLCSELPYACNFGNSGPRWAAFGSCTYECVSVTDNSGEIVSSDCTWNCDAFAGPSIPSITIRGWSPRVHLDNPEAGALVAGWVDVRGWAVDLTPGVRVRFGVDGQEVALQGAAYGQLAPAACAPPFGIVHGACSPLAGFFGRLDTTVLSNGVHQLEIVAYDAQDWATVVKVPIVVANSTCETVAPVVTATAPNAAATLRGTVTVSAQATDNVGVSSVEFLLDGALFVVDTAAPFAFHWDTTRVSDGVHRWTFRARDACGNVGNAAEFTVGVSNAAARMRIVAAGGTQVTRGSTYSFPDTAPGTPVSRLFTIWNDGTADLGISNPTMIVSGLGWSGIEFPAAVVAPGASTSFRVRLQSASAGSFAGSVRIESNDPLGAFLFSLSGNVVSATSPRIRVTSFDGSVLLSGGTFLFPNTTAGVPVSRLFTIWNDGPGDLVLNNPTTLISGGGFSEIEIPAATIPVGGSAAFRIRLSSPTAGTYLGTVRVESNGSPAPWLLSLRGVVE